MAVVRIELEVNNKGEAQLAKVVGGLDDVGKAADRAKGKGSTFAKTLEGDLKGLGLNAGFAGQALGFLANPLTLVGGAAVGLAGMLALATTRLISTSSALSDLHAKTGISIEALQTLGYSGSLVGVSIDSVASAVTQMNKRLVESPQAFAKLGLSASSLKAMKADEALAAISDKIRSIQNPAEQTAAAMQLFGRGGSEILALLKSDLSETADEARRFGLVLSDETVAAADQLDDALTRLSAVWNAFLLQTAAGIASSETAADALDLITKAVGALAGQAADGRPKVTQLIDELLRLTQVGKVVAILSALSETSPTVKNKPDLGGPADINFEAILAAGMAESAKFVKETEKAQTAAAAAAKRHADEVKRLRDSYTGLDSVMRAALMDEALRGKGVLDSVLGDPGRLQQADKDIAGLNLRLDQLPATLQRIVKAAQDLRNKDLGQYIVDEIPFSDPFPEEAVASTEVPEGLRDAAVAWDELQQRMLIDGREALAAFAQDVVGLAGTLADLPNAFRSATDSSSRFRNMLGGARVGGEVGGQIGNVLFGEQGKAIGQFLGTVAGGIAGLFRTPSWIAAGKKAGQVLGIEVGEEMARAIEKRAKDLNISIESSALLSLDEAIASSGRTASSFAAQFAQLMAGIQKGTIPAAEGLEQVDKVFGLMREELEGMGPAGQSFLDSMVEMAQATGTVTASMKAFLKETAALGAGQLADVFKNATEGAGMTAERMADLGAIANGVLKRMQDGGATMSEIFEALGPAMDAAIEAAEKSGVALTGPFAQLAAQRAFFQSLPESLQASVDGFELLARAAGRTPEAIAGVSNEARRLYAEMYEAARATGATEEASRLMAMTPLAPTLSYLNQLAKEGKIVLDEQTAALIAEADAAGLLDSTPQEKMLEIANLQLLAISALVTAFGQQLPAAVQAYIDSLQNIPNVPGPPGAGNPGGGPGNQEDPNDPPGLAAGDILMPKPGGHVRRLAEAGQPELAAPVKAFSADLAEQLGRVVAVAGGQRGPGHTFRVDVDRRILAVANTESLRRNTGGSRNSAERVARRQRP